MMRVVQIINSFGYQSGGAERLVQDLHMDLLDAGVDAHLVALEACETDGLRNAVSLGFSSPYRPGVVSGPAQISCRDEPQAGRRACPSLSNQRLCCGSQESRSDPLPGDFYGAQHVEQSPRISNRKHRSIRWSMHQFETIYCISEGTRETLISAYPALQHKTDVILNGARLTVRQFHCSASRRAVSKLSLSAACVRPRIILPHLKQLHCCLKTYANTVLSVMVICARISKPRQLP